MQVNGGPPSYFDLTIKLTPTLSGTTVTAVKASATSTPSQIIDADGFQAGTYKDNNGNIYTVGGPGVGPGGATSWSIAYVSGTNGCRLAGGATWYTDTGSNNPEYAREQTAHITTTAYSFGVLGGEGYCVAAFNVGGLIGVTQSGNVLSITSYSSNGINSDQSTPVATMTFTKQ